MDKRELLQAFERLLETAPAPAPPAPDVGLAQVFEELAALKTEVRAEGRQAKQALESLHQALGTLQRESAAHERALAQVGRQTLRPLLLELVDLRDRLAAGIEALAQWRLGWFKRLWLREELRRLAAVYEGQRLTLERFDQCLAQLEVQPFETVGEPFDTKWMRTVEVIHDPRLADGVVTAEHRRGYRWQDETLRLAEVVVNRADGTSNQENGKT